MSDSFLDNSVDSLNLDTTAQEQLRDFVRRIEKIKKQQDDLAEELRDVYRDAAYSGFDVKILREVIKRRRADKEDIEKEEELVAIYLHAVESV